MNDIVVASLFRLPFVLVISDEKSSLFFSLANSDCRCSHKMAASVHYRFSAAVVAVCFVAAVCGVCQATFQAAIPLKFQETPKLLYFDKGIAEPIRLAFHLGGVEIEDLRINSSSFSAMKSKLPSGELPVLLQLGDEMYDGFNAILTYAGRRAGLMPSDPQEELKVNQILEAVKGLIEECLKVLNESDKNKRKEMGSTLANETVPSYIARINRMLKRGSSAFDFAVGNKLTVADLSLYSVVDILKNKDLGLPDSLVYSPSFRRIDSVELFGQGIREVRAWRWGLVGEE